MAEFKISRIRYTWKGAWNTSTAYIADDVVRFGGSTWVCMRNHISSTFQGDQEFLANPQDTDYSPAWFKMMDGYAFVGNWEEDTLYSPGDVALYGGRLYVCTESHTSNITFEENNLKWFVFTNLHNWVNDWAAETRYGIGDLAKYGGVVYRCILEHTSADVAGGLEENQLNWSAYYSGIEFVGAWTADERYRPDDLVKYGGSILRCVSGHTATTFEPSAFITEFPGFKFQGEWDVAEFYAVGDIVRHGGYLYKSISNNTGETPDNLNYGDNTNWQFLSKAINFRGAYDKDTAYHTGDLVRRGGTLYVALTDRTPDGSSIDYLNTSDWKEVAPGVNWKNGWKVDELYGPGDVVNYRGVTWACNYGHVASYQNFPSDDNGSGNNYWDRVVDTGIPAGLSNRGDLLTYDFFREDIGDESSLGVTRVAVGQNTEYLTIDDQDSLTYSTWGNNEKFIHVAPNGIDSTDDPEQGKNWNKPFKTIQFAAQEIESWGEAGWHTTINLRTGMYHEVLPIVLPEKVSIVGDELRGVQVAPMPAVAELANDLSYSTAALEHISSLLPALMKGETVNPTPGNTAVLPPLVSTVEEEVTVEVGGEIIVETQISTTFYFATDETINFVQGLIDDIIAYATYYIDGTGNLPTMTGSNNTRTDGYYGEGQEWPDSIQILHLLKTWIAEEASAFIAYTFPDYEFNPDRCKRDMRKYVEAWTYDVDWNGNYKSLVAARLYKNAVLGSETEDMFYMRNSTGLRNMTLTGLSGTLSPPAVNELYRRPTGGAFTSLDPGWGPDDEKVWIHTRSPFMSNVTTFGENCTGQKVDGSLHNGGYKSFVSNDYTQIISDGIGAWITNSGRAELVSVFTYYAQIGMFSENGGIIRATNGNSSYGDYGAIAEGNDPEETPRYGTVNGRTQQAQVAAAFAGEINDYILILEYSNAGQEYTRAGYNFVGSGYNAQAVQEEFRDNAIFEIQVKNAPGLEGNLPGGSNYSLIGNNAQTGNSTGITIASNDDHTEEELLGLRILITSGDGTGQYGYVTAYNPLTKRVEVSRESDDRPGWDHVIPGTPPVASMTTNATYKFEPRLEFEKPPFSANSADMVIGAQWHSLAYGETYEVYNGVQGSEGEGETIDIIPYVATWNVVKNGRNYEVEMLQGGAGYEAGQTVTILAAQVGGQDNENDITITVLSVSDDSTNSIMTFAHNGVAQSGRWVAMPAVSDKTVSAIDGEQWVENSLPSAGKWYVTSGTVPNGQNGETKPIFVAVKNNSSQSTYSYDGKTWVEKTLPAARQWVGITYGNGVFLAISQNLNAGAYSTNGLNWTEVNLPDSVDSTIAEWVDVTYGQGKFVALASSDNQVGVGTYNADTDTWTWTAYVMDSVADSSQLNWISIAYGNNRFVAISNDGNISYSFDAIDWMDPTMMAAGYDGMPTQDGSTLHEWRQIRYGQGLFMAVGNTAGRTVGADPTIGPTTWIVTSEDGLVWEGHDMPVEGSWGACAFGNPDISLGDSTISNSTPMWVITPDDNGYISCTVKYGKRAQGRMMVTTGRITDVRIWDPGSGYSDPPAYTITDPVNTLDAYLETRIGDGVLCQPSWVNRGTNYKTSSTTVTAYGDGYADQITIGQFVTIDGLTVLPGPGAQFRFRGETDYFTVATVELDQQNPDGTFTGYFRVGPKFSVDYNLEHGTEVEIREQYSQVRITGHDFLDVGTGNFIQTNYPELYTSASFYQAAPENEVYEANGGRVFYTSTDQDGNFRTGELFAVEQATGIVTISADFFDLDGLTELALGGVRLGGSGAVIREFSTDSAFTADSNNVVPTQRAIKAYLQNRLNVGGSDLLTASFIAGTILVGPNQIKNSASLKVKFPVKVNIEGAEAGIRGSILAQNMFYYSFGRQTGKLGI